jgi:hypothetical protein
MGRIGRRVLPLLVLGVIALGPGAALQAAGFEVSRIFIEYNSTDNDLGFHVSLDAEEWKSLKIVNPAGVTILDLAGRGPYGRLGLSELFFEGAEPNLDEFPLQDLLALFPEGKYKFTGVTVSGTRLSSTGTLSHAIPSGPAVSSEVNGDQVTIRWEPVTEHPDGFPDRRIDIVGYQIIVEPFQVTLPASATEVTLPVAFVQSLRAGAHGFEVLAIDASGNQTITAGSFDTN